MSNQEQLTQMIGAAVMDYILDTEEPTANDAWFKARLNFPGEKWPAGLGKEDLTKIYDRTAEELEKPLTGASIRLAKQEADLKQELVDALYQVTPTGPDHCRTLMSVVQKLRSQREPEYLGAIKDALEELAATEAYGSFSDRAHECWPTDLGEEDEA